MMNTDEMSLIFFIDYIKRKMNRDWWQVRVYEMDNLYKVYDDLKDNVEISCSTVKMVHDKNKLNKDSLHKFSIHNKRIRFEYEKMFKNQKCDVDFYIHLAKFYENIIEDTINIIDGLINTQSN